MLITPTAPEYLARAIALIDEGKIKGSMDCPECDQTIDMHDEGHIAYMKGWGSRGTIPMGDPMILIACQGYYTLADQIESLR
jgi:hypothetical protein